MRIKCLNDKNQTRSRDEFPTSHYYLSFSFTDTHTHTHSHTPLVPIISASLMTQMVKNLPAMQETQVQSLGQENPVEKRMDTTLVFFPGKSHGQRSLVGYSSWGHRVRHD